MYAIVNIAGQQFRAVKDNKIFVHRLKAEIGKTVEFNDVLLLDEEGKIQIGKPYLDGVSVVAKVLAHEKSDKVLVFKKKRRKGYQKLNGHRQYMTQILIEGIFSGVKLEKKEPKKSIKEKPVISDPVIITEQEKESQNNIETTQE